MEIQKILKDNNGSDESNYFLCFCSQKFSIKNEEELSNHIAQCKEYQKNSPLQLVFNSMDFKSFTKPQVNLNKNKINQQLLAIKYELSNQLKLINQAVQQTTKEEIKKQKDGMEIQKNFSFEFESQLKTIECGACKKKFYDFDVANYWYIEQCLHIICRACLSKAIIQNYVKQQGQIYCINQDPTCEAILTQNDLNSIVGKKKLEELNEKLFQHQYNIVSCNKCQQKFEFIRGQLETNLKTPDGKPLQNYLAQHYAENRFICPNEKCKTEQCRNCKLTPYHKFYTCEEWVKNKNAKHCRYCEECFDQPNQQLPEIFQDICQKEECQQKVKNACSEKLQCGHPCPGIKGEKYHMPCLFDQCAVNKKSDKLLGQVGSDFCNICFTEGLINSPVVQIKCGHVFHQQCLAKNLQIRWHRPRISFSFCQCPLCKKWMEFPEGNDMDVNMADNLALFEQIKSMALKRLKYEERDKEPRLSKVGDPYYQKPTEYAMAIYSYYQCFKCKEPYFGGLKSCENLLQEEERKGNKAGDFNPKDLICAKCCDIPIIKCQKHGTDYIEFKCKYCCSIAQWFCFGTTHFCDPCHSKAGIVIYDKNIKKCPGVDKCPLKIKHKPNGEECALGCALCRNFKESQKEF